MLHHLFICHYQILIIFILFTCQLQAVKGPPGDTIQDPIGEATPVECDSHEEGPSVAECNAALTSFINTVFRRGFSLTEKIEFLKPGSTPFFADQYPRQPLTASGQYHTFTGNAEQTCIVQFFMFEPLDPTGPPSSVSTYSDFLAGARTLIGTCVRSGFGGWTRLRAQGRHVAVQLHQGNKDDVDHAGMVKETSDYQILATDETLTPKSQPDQVGLPRTGDSGQGSSRGPGASQGQTYCNTKNNPPTCQAGSSCVVGDVELDGTTRQQMILWGEVTRRLIAIAGTCVEAKLDSK
ncbi:MAG: hypothetical protein M1812_001147 [Candelaria pacifica]|nr:MAG: hypothetical protein M1812_001147 [Candelaria pacifica]